MWIARWPGSSSRPCASRSTPSRPSRRPIWLPGAREPRVESQPRPRRRRRSMSWLPQLSERRQRQVLGVLLVALTGLVAASLASYRPPVLGARPWAETNASGPVGAWLAHLVVGRLGRAAAWGVPVLLFATGWNRLR